MARNASLYIPLDAILVVARLQSYSQENQHHHRKGEKCYFCVKSIKPFKLVFLSVVVLLESKAEHAVKIYIFLRILLRVNLVGNNQANFTDYGHHNVDGYEDLIVNFLCNHLV